MESRRSLFVLESKCANIDFEASMRVWVEEAASSRGGLADWAETRARIHENARRLRMLAGDQPPSEVDTVDDEEEDDDGDFGVESRVVSARLAHEDCIAQLKDASSRLKQLEESRANKRRVTRARSDVTRLESRVRRLKDALDFATCQRNEMRDLLVLGVDLETLRETKDILGTQLGSLVHQQAMAVTSGKRGIRWSADIVQWCLRVYAKSPAAYREMASGGLLHLPTERTLKKKYASTMDVFGEATDEVIDLMAKSMDNAGVPKGLRRVQLAYDDVKIKKGIVWSATSKTMVGFVSERFREYASVKFGDLDPSLAVQATQICARCIVCADGETEETQTHFTFNLETHGVSPCAFTTYFLADVLSSLARRLYARGIVVCGLVADNDVAFRGIRELFPGGCSPESAAHVARTSRRQSQASIAISESGVFSQGQNLDLLQQFLTKDAKTAFQQGLEELAAQQLEREQQTAQML